MEQFALPFLIAAYVVFFVVADRSLSVFWRQANAEKRDS